MRKSQSATEVAIVIACVAAGLLVVQAYFRRGFSGQIKGMSDSSLGNQFDPQHGSFGSTSFQSGDMAYATKFIHDANISAIEGGGDANATYPVSYQVLGPDSYVEQGVGNVVPADSTRKPMNARVVTKNTVENRDLGDK